MNADWLTLAIYALNRALPGGEHTDPWRLDRELPSGYGDSNILANLPSLDEMNKELLYEQNPYPEEPDLDPYAWYDYDDAHPSNQQRFYVKNGLAEGPPLMLGEIAAVGLPARAAHRCEQGRASSQVQDSGHWPRRRTTAPG